MYVSSWMYHIIPRFSEHLHNSATFTMHTTYDILILSSYRGLSYILTVVELSAEQSGSLV